MLESVAILRLFRVTGGLFPYLAAQVIVYDQLCATEKRRSLKRSAAAPKGAGGVVAAGIASTRMFINARVCEGCGDCGKQSNCVAVVPLETPLGRKRAIDQAACNLDLSCNRGFCPSFVSVSGAAPKFGPSDGAGSLNNSVERSWFEVPAPKVREMSECNVLICGVGGGGVVTTAAMLGQAAHFEGFDVNVFDQIGLSQKGGAVVSHVRIRSAEPLKSVVRAPRIGSAGASLVLALDLVTAVVPTNVSAIRPGFTRVVANTHAVMPGRFTSEPDLPFPTSQMLEILSLAANSCSSNNAAHDTGLLSACNFRAVAEDACGDPLVANVVALGYAYQRGDLGPLSATSILRAVDKVAQSRSTAAINRRAFEAGRRTAHDPQTFAAVLGCEINTNSGDRWHPSSIAALKTDSQASSLKGNSVPTAVQELDDAIAYRAKFLKNYHDPKYAGRYTAMVATVRKAEETLPMLNEVPGIEGYSPLRITRAVAEGYFRIMAYKDEYEVARLFTDGEFESDLRQAFSVHQSGTATIKLHISPPGLAGLLIDSDTGLPRKIAVPYRFVRPLLKLLAAMRTWRNTFLDPFRFTADRRRSRALLTQYETDISMVLAAISDGLLHSQAARRDKAACLLELVSNVRGFGHVREHSEQDYARSRKEILEGWD